MKSDLYERVKFCLLFDANSLNRIGSSFRGQRYEIMRSVAVRWKMKIQLFRGGANTWSSGNASHQHLHLQSTMKQVLHSIREGNVAHGLAVRYQQGYPPAAVISLKFFDYLDI